MNKALGIYNKLSEKYDKQVLKYTYNCGYCEFQISESKNSYPRIIYKYNDICNKYIVCLDKTNESGCCEPIETFEEAVKRIEDYCQMYLKHLKITKKRYIQLSIFDFIEEA